MPAIWTRRLKSQLFYKISTDNYMLRVVQIAFKHATMADLEISKRIHYTDGCGHSVEGFRMYFEQKLGRFHFGYTY